MVFDTANNVLYYSDSQYILKNAGELPFSENLKSAVVNNRQVESMECTIGGETYYCSTSYLDSIDWACCRRASICPRPKARGTRCCTASPCACWC